MSAVRRVIEQLNQVILGKDTQVKMALACVCWHAGNLLIEDLPGMGKTTLSHALASSLGLHYQRLQFTADLLPSDILGVSVLSAKLAVSLVAFAFTQALCLAKCFWPMKSIELRPRRKVRCWRRWKKGR